MANQKRSKVQQNLHNPNKPAPSHKVLRRILAAEREEREAYVERQASRVERELSNDSYKRMVSRYSEVFDSNLAEFLQTLHSEMDGKYHAHMANLCVRLDYNGYVTKRTNFH
jgi:hypothetical protein